MSSLDSNATTLVLTRSKSSSPPPPDDVAGTLPDDPHDSPSSHGIFRDEGSIGSMNPTRLRGSSVGTEDTIIASFGLELERDPLSTSRLYKPPHRSQFRAHLRSSYSGLHWRSSFPGTGKSVVKLVRFLQAHPGKIHINFGREGNFRFHTISEEEPNQHDSDPSTFFSSDELKELVDVTLHEVSTTSRPRYPDDAVHCIDVWNNDLIDAGDQSTS